MATEFINRADLVFTYPAGVKYIGRDLHFERPARLTKFDIASILSELQPQLNWRIIYDVFSYSELCSTLNKAFEL